jgi:hypothetical protein
MFIEDGYASSTSFAVNMVGDATYQPDQMELHDLYITSIGASYWNRCININGSARTAPQGCRVLNASNLQLFRSNNYPLLLWGVVQGTFMNVGTYSGTGSLSNNIYIGGGGSSLTNSVNLSIFGLNCEGELNVTNVTNFDLRGTTSTIVAGSSATDGFVRLISGGALVGAFGGNVNSIIL